MNLLVVEDNPRDMKELLNLLHGWKEQNPTRITTPTRWTMIIKKSPLKTPRFTKEREPGRCYFISSRAAIRSRPGRRAPGRG